MRELLEPTTTVIDIEDLTRREVLKTAGAFGLGWVIVACGGDDDEENQIAGNEGATREFVDDAGRTVQVPDEPRRIIALSDSNGADQVLSLGVELIGMVTRGGSFELGDVYDLSDVESVGEIFQVDIEQIQALEPDLIIGPASGGQPSGYEDIAETIEAIAPTVWIDTFRPVRQVMEKFADLLAVEAELDGQHSAYDQRIDDLVEMLGERRDGLTVSVVQFNEGVVDVFGEGWFPFGEVLADAGIQRPASQSTGEAAETCCASLSVEQMEQVNADVILYFVSSADHSNNPLFQSLPAVQAGQAFEWTDDWWGNTYRALNTVLDALEVWLVDVDPTVVQEDA